MNNNPESKELNDSSYSKSVNDERRKLWTYNCDRLQNASNVHNRISFSNSESEKSKELSRNILRVAARPYNILITGETGTGKTFAARQIHQNSARAKGPFMELNCANLSESLVEAELFGFRKGAFTGADRDHKGLFEEADGGILFLDEIGDVPPAVQNKLLKAIDEKKIKRLGTNHYTSCDVQIISATSRNLAEMTGRGEFRIDLYCRLAVLTIEVPPLRERREDIPAMIDYYLREAAHTITGTKSHDVAFKIECGAVEMLCRYDYPGNVRALKNLIYELTSFVSLDEPITIELVQTALAKPPFNEGYKIALEKNLQASKVDNSSLQSFNRLNGEERLVASTSSNHISNENQSIVRALVTNEGDLILPAEICVIHKGETFSEWAARAKQLSIEAAREATGGTLQNAAKRLGVTRGSLKGHLGRAKMMQRRARPKR